MFHDTGTDPRDAANASQKRAWGRGVAASSLIWKIGLLALRANGSNAKPPRDRCKSA